MPSGVSPLELWRNPEAYGKIPCGIRVPNTKAVVDELREDLPRTREEVNQWVTDEFNEAAQSAYDEIGSPELKMTEGWRIFANMLSHLEEDWRVDYV